MAAALSELEAAKAKLKAEQANVNASTANVLAAEARADKSTTEKMFHNVASPFTGVIVERNIDEGMLVSAGSENSKQPLYRVARLDIAKVFVDVPQFAASSIKPGQAVSITLKEQPGSIFEGKIARTSVALDPVARTLRTEVHVPNPRLQLIPGMYADVNLKAARDTTQTVLIPANSLVVRNAKPQVLIVDVKNKVHFRSVKLGDDLGKQVEIVDGIANGTRVIINPSDTLTEGEPVTISTTGE